MFSGPFCPCKKQTRHSTASARSHSCHFMFYVKSVSLKILGVPSPFFPGIILSREPSQTQDKNGMCLERPMVENNGESTPRKMLTSPNGGTPRKMGGLLVGFPSTPTGHRLNKRRKNRPPTKRVPFWFLMATGAELVCLGSLYQMGVLFCGGPPKTLLGYFKQAHPITSAKLTIK